MAPDQSGTRPTVPDRLPRYLVEGVEKQSVAALHDLVDYAEAMAEWKAAQAKRELEARVERDTDEVPAEFTAEEWRDCLAEARDEGDVPPGKGTLTVKTIEGNDYYYLQWRDGEQIRSKYVAPVSPG